MLFSIVLRIKKKNEPYYNMINFDNPQFDIPERDKQCYLIDNNSEQLLAVNRECWIE